MSTQQQLGIKAWKQKAIKGMEELANRIQSAESRIRSFYRVTKMFTEEVLHDPEFRADIGNPDEKGAMQFLNQYVKDGDLQFFELRGIYEMFPDEEVWVKEGLNGLRSKWITEIVRREKEERKAVAGAPRTRRSVKLAEHEKIKEEHGKLKEHLPAVESKLKEAEQKLAEVEPKLSEREVLLAENRKLRVELANARKEIAELHAKLAEAECRIAELEELKVSAGV